MAQEERLTQLEGRVDVLSKAVQNLETEVKNMSLNVFNLGEVFKEIE